MGAPESQTRPGSGGAFYLPNNGPGPALEACVCTVSVKFLDLVREPLRNSETPFTSCFVLCKYIAWLNRSKGMPTHLRYRDLAQPPQSLRDAFAKWPAAALEEPQNSMALGRKDPLSGPTAPGRSAQDSKVCGRCSWFSWCVRVVFDSAFVSRDDSCWSGTFGCGAYKTFSFLFLGRSGPGPSVFGRAQWFSCGAGVFVPSHRVSFCLKSCP